MACTVDTQSPASLPHLPDCGITSFGIVHATRGQIPELRNKPHDRHSLPVKLLKYADDQTVVALAAVLHAIHDGNVQDRRLTDWGVVAGPRFLGRDTIADSFARFRRRGALGVSPVYIPYLSTHAVSGMISLALHIHGPNVGVGGGRGSLVDALLAGLTMQQDGRLPGVLTVISAWDPEPVPGNDTVMESAVCRAVCLVLMPVAANWHGMKLQAFPGSPVESGAGAKDTITPPACSANLEDLAQFLANSSDANQHQRWSCPWCWNGRLEVTRSVESQVSTPGATEIQDVRPAHAA